MAAKILRRKTNPNAPTQEVTLDSADGLLAVGVGLQARLGASTAAFTYAAGLVTDELAAVSAALVTISDAENGVVTPGAGFAADYWNSEYRTIKTANDLIVGSGTVTLDPGTRSALLGMAYLIKAAAIGELIQGFKQVALDTYNTNQATGRLRVVNAVSDPARADRVNITVAGTLLAVNIAYGSVAPALGVQLNPATYYPIYAGAWPLTLRRTADTTVKVLDQTIDVAANTDYTVIVLGQSTGVTVTQLTDNNTAPADGTVRLRVVHTSLSAPGTVDIYVTAATTDIATVPPTAAGVPRGGATPYLSLALGVHRVRVTAAGQSGRLRM